VYRREFMPVRTGQVSSIDSSFDYTGSLFVYK
jgi:hypothetical protein